MIQLQMLNYILANRDASPIILNNLTAKYFSEYKNEFNFIKNHYEKYGNTPDLETFLSVFSDFEVINVTETVSYLVDELFKDYRTRNMADTFNKVRSLLLEGKTEEAAKVYQDGADALSSDVSLTCVDLFRDTSRYDEYVDRTQNINNYYLTTGFRELDKIIGGIDLKEELGIIMARTNMGKSFLALKMATAAAMMGYNVGFYSGEMSVSKVGTRMDTIIGHFNSGYIMHGNTAIQNKYYQYIKELQTKYNGSLKVLTPVMAGGKVGVGTLKAFIEKEKLDILFIDQLSLVDDDRHGKSVTERVSNIIIDLKKLQVMKQMPIIAVSQQNRTKNDDNTIDTTQIAGSDDVGKYATWVLGISRDKKDETIFTIEVVKARDGGVGKKLIYCVDLSVGTFTYIPNENDGIEDKDTEQQYASRYEVDDASGEDVFK